MTRVCIHCGGTGLAVDPVEAELVRIVEECHVAGITIAHDGTIPEKAVSALLPLSARTIEGWRYRGNPLGSELVGGRRRVSLRRFAHFRCAERSAILGQVTEDCK